MSALKMAAVKDEALKDEAPASQSWVTPFTDNNANDTAASPAVLQNKESPSSSNGGIRQPRLKAAVAANVNEV